MARLRGPGGCPWDREQTFDTIKPYTLEETYEVLDAIDGRDWHELAEELGDFMLQAVFYAQMAAEQKLFRIDDALDAINEKLVRRHPHVFGDETAEHSRRRAAASGARSRPRRRKRRGRRTRACSTACPRSLPALVEAQQIASRAAKVGFDWENPEQVLEKLHEELAEIRRRAPQRRRSRNSRTKSATCSSSSSTWPGSSRWIPSRRCARPTPSSASASATSSASSPSAARRPPTLRHRRNGVAVAGSENSDRGPANSSTAREFEEAVQLQKQIWGFDDIELLPVRLFVVATKIGGQAFGAFDGDRMVGFCLAIPGLKPGGQLLPAQPHAGRAAGVPRPRHRPPHEAGAARRRAAARHRPDRVDLRSAGNQERLLQHGAAGRGRAPLRPEPVRHHHQPAARRPADRPLHRRMVGRRAPACSAILAGRPRRRRAVEDSHRRARRHRRHPHATIRSARAKSSRRIGEQFHELFDAASPSSASTARTRTGLYLLGPAMKIDRIILRQIRMPLVHFFETSFGRTYQRDIILVEVRPTASPAGAKSPPARIPSTTKSGPTSAWLILRDYAGPRVLGRRPSSRRRRRAADRAHPRPPDGPRRARSRRLGPRGAPRRRAALADTSAAAPAARSPAASPSASRTRCRSCSRRSSANSPPATSASRSRSSRAGTSTSSAQVRERFPDIKLMADANSAYTLADTDAPQAARRLLPDDDRAAARPRRHHRPRRAAGAARRRPSAWTSASAPRTTPSRRSSCAPAASSTSSWAASAASARRRRVHDVAQAAGIPVWCGGMLEAGIGRAHNIALATLPNFVLPGDVSASKRYWARDIITPAGRDHAARHHRAPRRARLRLRARPRLHPRRSPCGRRRSVERELTAAPLRPDLADGAASGRRNYIVAKIALREFPPLLLAGLRITIAGALIAASLLVASAGTRWTRMAPGDVPLLLGLGVFGVALNQIFFVLGLSRTSVGACRPSSSALTPMLRAADGRAARPGADHRPQGRRHGDRARRRRAPASCLGPTPAGAGGPPDSATSSSFSAPSPSRCSRSSAKARPRGTAPSPSTRSPTSAARWLMAPVDAVAGAATSPSRRSARPAGRASVYMAAVSVGASAT